ncbi:MAG TPA: DNA gyrase C-terminal beta-propeller domain-containing protein, partial [Promineifilum sp.]|nr:DNA gyrase C-terminal beta-propeller domain-containing protein [Promineifilum sp.]
GLGKRTPLTEYRRQGRYGQGIKAMNLTPERTGAIVAARVVSPKDEVTLISAGGIILRMVASHISQQGRASQGVRVMDLREGDAVVSVAVIPEARQALAEVESAAPETAEAAMLDLLGSAAGHANGAES